MWAVISSGPWVWCAVGYLNVWCYCDSGLEFGWQVQAVLLLLGGREIPPGMTGVNASSHNHHKVCLLMMVLYMNVTMILNFCGLFLLHQQDT